MSHHHKTGTALSRFEILHGSHAQPYLAELQILFDQQWDDVEPVVPFVQANGGVLKPEPLIARYNNKALAGGLAFTQAPRPQQAPPLPTTGKAADQAVWINALFVKPQYRKQGLAQKLVSCAIEEANNTGIVELFVYTEYPLLYKKLGWRIIVQELGHEKNDYVLRSALGSVTK